MAKAPTRRPGPEGASGSAIPPLLLTARERVLTMEEVKRNLLRELAELPVIRRK